MLERITRFSMDRPYVTLGVVLILTIFFGLQFSKIHIDTDPENMLEPDQPDRIFYDSVKDKFGINDLLVVGIVDEEGIFRPEALEKISNAISEILTIDGIIIEDVVSLTTTDNVKSDAGLLDIHPVLREIPTTPEALEQLRADIAGNPFLNEKIVSADGTATAMYIPIESKDQSYRIARQIGEILDRELLSGEEYHLAGLPVAEDTFGHEMFIQMAVVAPIAFIAILLLIYILFRKSAFLVPLGLHAMISVIWAMGLLIGLGNIVHIMSSMIPVFLMPIAVLDDIHVLSEFSDRYKILRDKRRALIEGMKPLYIPMLFTSLTSAVGFGSLMMAGIPPVRVFGLYAAFGIMAAWALTITMLPAMISLMSDKMLEKGTAGGSDSNSPVIDKFLGLVKRVTKSRSSTVIIVSILFLIFSMLGVARIKINDNPVRWFKTSHPMRIADRVMNGLFGGTYMVYLVVDGNAPEAVKNPDVVKYINDLQAHLESTEIVGQTSSIADIVKRINYVLHDNDPEYDMVPDSSEAIGQFLFLFQSSGDPNDLDNFIDMDARSANIWIQMKGGDNQQMHAVENHLASYMKEKPPPDGITIRWTGLTYINQIWQNLMVSGMLRAAYGSFLVVFFLMIFEFRSFWLAVLSMVPLTLSIVLSYGLAGWVGKDYDMPIAVCSSIALGLAIDFAIHFIQRFSDHFKTTGNFSETFEYIFEGPGKAIARSAVVISLGFLPLLLSTLTPYVTVGVFFAMIMAVSTLATLFILPAVIKLIGPRLFRGGKK